MLNLGLYKLHSNFDADSVMRWPDPRGGKTRQLNMRPGFIMLQKEIVFMNNFIGYCINKSKIKELLFFNIRNKNFNKYHGFFKIVLAKMFSPFYRILIRSTGVTGN